VKVVVRPSPPLRGSIEVPGDKSISHRAAIIGALASGPTEVTGYLEAGDCLGSLTLLSALGVEMTRKGPGHYLIAGAGLTGFQEPEDVLDLGNSGTTARLGLGLLAGQPFWSMLTGDESLRRRPMGRVAEPLRKMGALVVGRDEGGRLPLAVRGARPLKPIRYRSPVASAQVKSALLLAGLYAGGSVTVEEPTRSRDHTERMLVAFGADLTVEGRTVTLTPGRELIGHPLRVPGDLSSAAFFLVGGIIVRDSAVVVTGVGVNPTRTAFIEVLREMGARVGQSGLEEGDEPTATLSVQSALLRGVSVGGTQIPGLIDEIPVLAVAAACAGGVTEVRDAAELRVKESDRIRAVATELAKLGARIEERPDGFRIHGGAPLRGAVVQSWGDHRMAMALTVAGLVAEGQTVVEDTQCIATSYPDFLPTLGRLVGESCLTVVP
jgi:3-phosphoshikimate 1-carboxyvinyltransferase